MTTYQCVDGPLAGREVTRRLPADGVVTVAVLDVEHSLLAVDYRLEDGGSSSSGGRLCFVGARDVRPRRGLRRFLPV